MPTGIGNRKVLTPRSSKNPRRSLPPQAKLIEAAGFDSFEDQPSSPDIMTTKLMEKVKNNVKKTGGNTTGSASNSKGASLNQRLTAAATPSKSTSKTVTNSTSLAANAGRSKLSTEEFNMEDDDDNDRESSELSSKYKKNINSSSGSSGYNKASSNDKKSSSYNTSSTSNTSYNSASNKSYNSASKNNYNNAGINNSNAGSNHYNTDNNNFNSGGYNNNYNNSYSSTNNGSYTSSKPLDYNSTPNNLNNSRTGGYSKLPMPYSDINSNSFDRWNNNSGSSVGGNESVELLQEQLNHLRKEYDGLKQRFNDLSILRLSEPEEMLEEHKKLSEFRDQAAEKTIKALHKENEQLKKQLTVKYSENSVEAESKAVDDQDHEDHDEDHESKNEKNFMTQVEKILKIYSCFSGLKITPSPSNPLTQWHCEFSSRSGRFDFQLIYESELNRYQYIPLDQSTTSGSDDDRHEEEWVKNLPQFLASDILITADQMQIFFWRLLDTLSKKQK